MVLEVGFPPIIGCYGYDSGKGCCLFVHIKPR